MAHVVSLGRKTFAALGRALIVWLVRSSVADQKLLTSCEKRVPSCAMI